MPKDDPLSNEVSEQLSKHTLWLNSDNFAEMVQASHDGLQDEDKATLANWVHMPPEKRWRLMCVAALAVVEWRMTGRVRP